MPVGLLCRFRERPISRGTLVAALVVTLGVTGGGVASARQAPHNARAATAGSAQGALFAPMSPTRVLDTRTGTGTGGVIGPVTANGVVIVDLSSVLPSSATSVVLNLTATDVTDATYVTAFPADGQQGTASNLNLVAGETRSNLVTVVVSQTKQVVLHNFAGTVDLIADVAGYYSSDSDGAGFSALSPTRVLDTRDGNGPVGPNGTVTIDLSGQVPAGTTAVTFNLTATDVTDPTYVTAFPDTLSSPPTASNLNVVTGETRAALVTVKLDTDRKLTLYNFAGSVDLVADLAGYYAPGKGDPFYSLASYRALDTRNYQGESTANTLGANQTRALDLSKWLPASAHAVVFNYTGTNTTTPTYLSAFPDGTTQPTASNVNLVAGQTAPNLSVVSIGGDQKIDLYNFAGKSDVLVDLAGYFAAPQPECTSQCLDAWSTNGQYGQLGDGNSGNATATPSAVAGLSGVTAVSGGATGAVALRSDGTVWSWGLAPYIGSTDGTTPGFSPVPVQVPDLSGIVGVAGDSLTGFALANDGTVWSWGNNSLGQLGYVTTAPASLTPNKVPGITGVTKVVATSLDTYVVKSDGTVWAWGSINYGALGNGSNGTGTQSSGPVQVSGLTNATSMAATEAGGAAHAIAVESDGSVWQWGQGVNDQSVAAIPVQVDGLSGISAVGAGAWSLYAVRKSDGTVWAWGNNGQGQLGDGSTDNSDTPVQVSGLTGVTAISGGLLTTALKSDGTVWAWGLSVTGGLGSGGTEEGYNIVPLQVVGLSGVTALSSGGDLGSWGDTEYALTSN